MSFQTERARREYFRRMEVTARRPVGSGALHPDRCDKLPLQGVNFAIPPRGTFVAPSFDGGRVTVVAGVTGDWPEARRLIALMPVRRHGRCRTCGRPRAASVELALDGGAEFLAACFELAGKLLDRQYRLTPPQKAELLGFAAEEPPEWIARLIRWAAAVGGGRPGGSDTRSAPPRRWRPWRRMWPWRLPNRPKADTLVLRRPQRAIERPVDGSVLT